MRILAKVRLGLRRPGILAIPLIILQSSLSLNSFNLKVACFLFLIHGNGSVRLMATIVADPFSQLN